MHPVSKFPKAFFFCVCVPCSVFCASPCRSTAAPCYEQTANTHGNLSRQVTNIKSRTKLTCKFSTVLQNFIPVNTAHIHSSGRSTSSPDLAWEGNSFVFHPPQLGEERETAKGCFKLSQTLKRKIMFYFISETWLQHYSSCKAMVNILTTKLWLKVEICDQIPCYSINNPCQY